MALSQDGSRTQPLLVVRDRPHSPEAESFRTLRANLRFSALDKPPKSVLVTSSVPGEGKSTVSANLALAAAHAGSRVVVVGADLRRPSVHEYLGVSHRIGLSNVLTKHATVPGALQETGVEGLKVLASGPIPPNPGELLGAQRMAKVAEALGAEADMIVYDTPPVASVVDAAILSRHVDGVLLVVGAGSTPRDVIKEAKDQLDQVGANILGAVVNRLHARRDYQYYYYSDRELAPQAPWWRRVFAGRRGAPDVSPEPEGTLSSQAAAARDG